jgi:benzoate membrane transport protein
MSASRSAPVTAGVVTALVGFSSSFVVVLAGLTAMGATPGQAASGLIAVCVTQAAGMFWLSLRHRAPLVLAWSTPGAALLVSTGAVAGGWPAAVGAFAVAGVLLVLTALVPGLGALIARIPVSLARAMLAGVLLPICLAPVTSLAQSPTRVGPVVLTWLGMHLVSRRFAVPAALAVALAVVVVDAGSPVAVDGLWPSLAWTTPQWTLQALIGVALPLYVVTMASQNVPGAAVLASYGYRVPWRESMAVTGVGTLAGAPFGGHAVNLAAITAALAAGPDAGPDHRRRWIASVTAAAAYLLLALACPTLTALVAAAPSGVVQAAAGLALVGTLGSAAAGALADERDREAAVVTLLVAASGLSVLGVGAAFWALVAGLATGALMRGRGSRRQRSGPVLDAKALAGDLDDLTHPAERG